MVDFILYIFKSCIVLSIFWMIYFIFLRKETFFNFNRIYLLAGLILSLILPFLKYKYTINIGIPQSSGVSESSAFTGLTPNQNFPLFYLKKIAGVAYTGIAAWIIFHHLMGLQKLEKIIKKWGYTRWNDKFKLVRSPEIKSYFSFYDYIFSEQKPQITKIEENLILAHEVAHIEQKHWIDTVLAQSVCALQWFNPFSWFYLHAIKVNHEYLADKAVLDKGNSQALYKATLINQTMKFSVFTFSNSFAESGKISRIKMLMKKTSSSAKKYAVLLLIPALSIFIWAFAEPEYIVSPTKTEKTPIAKKNTYEQTVNESFSDIKPAKRVKKNHKRISDKNRRTSDKGSNRKLSPAKGRREENSPNTTYAKQVTYGSEGRYILVKGRRIDIKSVSADERGTSISTSTIIYTEESSEGNSITYISTSSLHLGFETN